LRLGPAVYLGYGATNVKPASNGYSINFDDDQIADLYPSLLAQVETAAGTQQDTYSLSKLPGMEVWSEDGHRLGTIQNLFFDASGSRAEAVYISMTGDGMNGEPVAIPFGQVQSENVNNAQRLTVSDDMAQAMASYVQTRK